MSAEANVLEVGDCVPVHATSEPALAAIAEAREKYPVVLYFLRAFT